MQLLDFTPVEALVLLEGGVMPIGQLGDEDAIVSLAAVLEEHLVDFPDRSDDGIVARRRIQNLLQEFKETILFLFTQML